jgi:hypothetical protein
VVVSSGACGATGSLVTCLTLSAISLASAGVAVVTDICAGMAGGVAVWRVVIGEAGAAIGTIEASIA